MAALGVTTGIAVAAGQHREQGWNFHPPYEMRWDDWNQRDWRYCYHCHGMFYAGYTNFKGVYPLPGQHRAQGHNFNLPYLP